jgi:hypothetical protein
MTSGQLTELADKIAESSLRIDVAKHAMLTHLRTFDAHDGGSGMGFISTAMWLSWRIGIGPGAAREHVRVARVLGELPLVDATFAAGKLSYAKVRAITRVATPETEQDFIDVAMHATASQIEKLTSAYRRVRVDPSEPTADLRRFVRRTDTRSGWCGSRCNYRRSRPTWCGRPCRLRSTPVVARARTFPRRCPTGPDRRRPPPRHVGPRCQPRIVVHEQHHAAGRFTEAGKFSVLASLTAEGLTVPHIRSAPRLR